MAWPNRLSFHQFTAGDRPLDALIEAASAAGVPRLALERRSVEDFGVTRAVQLVRSAGLEITSYGGVGYWASGLEWDGRERTLSDNVRSLDDAANLGTGTVVVSVGGLGPGARDIQSARQRVAEGLMELVPYAAQRNLKLALQPVHPMFCADRNVLSTIRQALDLIDTLSDESVGLVIDAYQVWWDPELVPQLRRAGRRVFLVQINDWPVKASNRFDRALMGEGCIDFGALLEALDPYSGWFEVETINDELRSMSLEEVLERVVESYERTIGRLLAAGGSARTGYSSRP